MASPCIFFCRCAHCQGFSEGALDSTAKIELDFLAQTIKYVCPLCKKESSMSIMTSNKNAELRPLPKMAILR